MTLALPTQVKEEVALENERRIFGPPGTGKTTYLSKLIEGYIKTKEYRPSEIIVTSFTRAAAAEVASRGTGIPEENIQTLHALGFHLIEGSKEITDTHINEWNSWLEGKGKKFSHIYGLSPQSVREDDENFSGKKNSIVVGGDFHFNRYMIHRAKLTLESEINGKGSAFVKFCELWKEWKSETGYIDFQDMIDIPFEKQLPLPSEVKVLICDEFQDFTAAEARLARFWGAQMTEFILAGDDDQCLYFFKGASSENFLNPTLPAERMLILEQSYRVPRAVQEYAERWISQVQHRHPKAYLPRRKVLDDNTLGDIITGAVIQMPGITITEDHETFVSNSWQAPENCLDHADLRYLSDNKEVMFLTSCAYMLNPLKELLREKGILFHNPHRIKRTDWNPLHSNTKGTSSIDRLRAFLRPSAELWGDQEARIWTIEDLWLWLGAVKVSEVLQDHKKTHKIIEQYYGEITDNDPDALSQSLDFVEHLSAWFTDEALQSALDQDLDWFKDRLLASKADAMVYPINIIRRYGISGLAKKPKVIIGTIHSVKGAAADVVYLFPDISREGLREKETREGEDALTRLFYVGMTRAREKLVLCPAASKCCVKFLNVQ